MLQVNASDLADGPKTLARKVKVVICAGFTVGGKE
jgi:hypothetical protein